MSTKSTYNFIPSIIFGVLVLMTHISPNACAQQWSLQLDDRRNIRLNECMPINEGSAMLSVGQSTTNNSDYYDRNGYVTLVNSDGSFLEEDHHLNNKDLIYICSTQLQDGNLMVFGVCDDSIHEEWMHKYLHITLFNQNLETIYEKTYSIVSDVFDGFRSAGAGTMNCITANSGNVILITSPCYYVSYPNGGDYYQEFEFFEFNPDGDIVQMKTPQSFCGGGGIRKITKEPGSDNLIYFASGLYESCGNFPGIWHLDENLNVTGRRDLFKVGDDLQTTGMTTDGIWIDDDKFIVDIQKYYGHANPHQMLFLMDTTVNLYAKRELLPMDTANTIPWGTSIAFCNDSTIFAVSYTSPLYSGNYWSNVHVTLLDKNLNQLGYKSIGDDNWVYWCSQPVPLNDGTCLIPIMKETGDLYQGEYIYFIEIIKLTREDFGSPWSTIEYTSQNGAKAYPNPTSDIINIPTNGIQSADSEIAIFDLNGKKYVSRRIDKMSDVVSIDIQNLEKGMYVYQVISRDKMIARGTFIKN